ncbi:unnamed protein product, partial [marine sediment metagenome]
SLKNFYITWCFAIQNTYPNPLSGAHTKKETYTHTPIISLRVHADIEVTRHDLSALSLISRQNCVV